MPNYFLFVDDQTGTGGRLRLGCSKKRSLSMPCVDVCSLRVIERLPGWQGRYFHSQSKTFAHPDFVCGASVHEHFHPQEEVYEVIEGKLEVTIDGVAKIARPGWVAIVPAGVRHSIKALTEGRAIIVVSFHPVSWARGGPTGEEVRLITWAA